MKNAAIRKVTIAALREQLGKAIETGAAVRAELTRKIAAGDDAALTALRHLDSAPRAMYASAHARSVLTELDAAELDAAGEDEQRKALSYCVRKYERWLEEWTPSITSNPLAILHSLAEYEAVKELLSLLRPAVTSKSAAATTAE